MRFIDGTYEQKQGASTIGVDYRSKILQVGGKRVKMQVWDTAGQERFGNVTSSFYRSAQAVILAYDITNKESFDNILDIWLPEIDRYTCETLAKVFVGNKEDLSSNRTVTLAEAQNRIKVEVLETSAKSGKNIEEAFFKLAEQALKNKLSNEKPVKKGETIDLKAGSSDKDK